MTDPKELPDNINELEQTIPEFEVVADKYTIKQLERKLRDAKVPFLSADDKPDLIWRWLDHQGVSFEVDPVVDAPASEPDATETPTETNKADDHDATNETITDGAATGTTDAPASDNEQLEPEQSDTPPPVEVVDKEAGLNSVTVKHTGAFDVLEPATKTLLYARKTTQIYVTPSVTKEQIVRNIEQYNITRGNILHINK